MTSLRDKFRGCIAASWVGSAMGAPVEGWSTERIRQNHGLLEELLPYKHYSDRIEWHRPAGTTEDGIERQKLIATAIIEKQDRIRADDLTAVWLRDLQPKKMVYKQEAFDRSLLELARAGVPASRLGRLWPFPNVVAVARASHPLGLINAGDPQGAADDTFDVGRAYSPEESFALRWAALYNAAIAEATRPGATVESVVETAMRFSRYRAASRGLDAPYDTIERELARAIELAGRHSDPAAMCDEFQPLYDGAWHVTYGASQANEIVSKGLAVFALTKGDPRRAIVAAVNFGRDTDCLAAVAGGLAGALGGAGAIPPQWIAQVNEATAEDPYTNNRRGIEETADALLEAFRGRHRRLADYLRTMDQAAHSNDA